MTHVHPDAHPETAPAPAPATGIDYLALVAAQHREQVARRINYTDLPASVPPPEQADSPHVVLDPALEDELASFAALHGQVPGQLDLTDALDDEQETA